MSKLQLSIAMGDYDRTRALLDGSVQIDGVDPVCMLLSPEETFFRAFRGVEFDISELSFSSYLVKASKGESPYIAVPVFLSRAFRHTSIYVRKDRIKKPEDLKGKRVGVPEYQLTANVWARAILQDDFGVAPSDITWVRGGIDTPGRPEKIKLQLPADVRLENAPEGQTISDLLDRGELDGFIAPRPPSGAASTNPNVGWLFDDPTATAKDYYRRTGVFPIMHVVGVKKELAAQHPWLPRRCAQSLQPGQGRGAGEAGRHLRHQGHPALRRRAVEERARNPGRRLLGLRRGQQPAHAGRLCAPPPRTGAVGAADVGG